MSDTLLKALTREGVLIAVSCRYWRAAKKLQASDLGLDPGDVTNRLISLGHKKLLPREALSTFALIGIARPCARRRQHVPVPERPRSFPVEP